MQTPHYTHRNVDAALPCGWDLIYVWSTAQDDLLCTMNSKGDDQEGYVM